MRSPSSTPCGRRARPQGEELAALRRAAAARQAEAETARRRLAEVERRAAEEAGQAEAATDATSELWRRSSRPCVRA